MPTGLPGTIPRRGPIGPTRVVCLSLFQGRSRLFWGRTRLFRGPTRLFRGLTRLFRGRFGTPGRHVGPIRGRLGRARGPVSLLRVPFRTVRRAVQPVRGDADRLGAVPRRPAGSRRAATGRAVTRAAAPTVPIVPGTVGRLPAEP